MNRPGRAEDLDSLYIILLIEWPEDLEILLRRLYYNSPGSQDQDESNDQVLNDDGNMEDPEVDLRAVLIRPPVHRSRKRKTEDGALPFILTTPGARAAIRHGWVGVRNNPPEGPELVAISRSVAFHIPNTGGASRTNSKGGQPYEERTSHPKLLGGQPVRQDTCQTDRQGGRPIRQRTGQTNHQGGQPGCQRRGDQPWPGSHKQRQGGGGAEHQRGSRIRRADETPPHEVECSRWRLKIQPGASHLVKPWPPVWPKTAKKPSTLCQGYDGGILQKMPQPQLSRAAAEPRLDGRGVWKEEKEVTEKGEIRRLEELLRDPNVADKTSVRVLHPRLDLSRNLRCVACREELFSRAGDETGNRHDVCPRLDTNQCPRCGEKVTPEGHECQPRCKICDQPHEMAPQRILQSISSTWSGKPPSSPRPARTLLIFNAVKRELRECVCLAQEDTLSLRSSVDNLSLSSSKQLKTPELYLKRLEFQLSKVEELREHYEVQQTMRDGMRSLAYAYVLFPGCEKDNAQHGVRSGYRQCVDTLCVLEAHLEQLMGTLQFQMKGIQGFARLCAGDNFEISVKHGKQKCKSRGRAQKNGQQGTNVLLGNKPCEIKELFSSHSQLRTVNLNSSGSLKLNLIITWNPLHGSLEESVAASKQSSPVLAVMSSPFTRQQGTSPFRCDTVLERTGRLAHELEQSRDWRQHSKDWNGRWRLPPAQGSATAPGSASRAPARSFPAQRWGRPSWSTPTSREGR
ncbi:hypothetical protein HPB47_005150 [Ixodes persulcatus]|uniref:Uncharacterized protein n=1 Tax=Ixodes persulcatus TaxID=34615 RepID=A0AC60PDT9_IXOPE|nr:hypothetical protein HPB47_005150 [Ixodes persulcatus]